MQLKLVDPLVSLDDAYLRKVLQNACRKLLQDCEIEVPPVPVEEKICNYLGVKISERKIPADALLIRAESGYEIVLNPIRNRMLSRRRYTIAHEISHILLMEKVFEKKILSEITSVYYREVEALCNFGAAEILMPTELMEKFIERHGLQLGVICKQFKVSPRAVLFRVPELIPSTAVVLWEKYARLHKKEAVCLRVRCNSHRYKDSQGLWLPEGCTTKHVSPDIVSHAHESGQVVYSERIRLVLSGKHLECEAIAIPMPVVVNQNLQLFESSNSVALIIGKKELIYRNNLWKEILSKIQVKIR